MAPTAALPERQERSTPVIFRADDPFLFLVHDNCTGAVLFLGRLRRPEM
ncbi:MAG: serpin family protein [Pirellulaceae bacterium]